MVGATADGQREMSASLGITAKSVGAEIRSTTNTIVVAHTDSGLRVHLDADAAAADRFLPVNRVKPHTCFKGPVESGVRKMAVVGFGKQPGASLVHTCGPIEMRDRLHAACDALRASRRFLVASDAVAWAPAMCACATCRRIRIEPPTPARDAAR